MERSGGVWYTWHHPVEWRRLARLHWAEWGEESGTCDSTSLYWPSADPAFTGSPFAPTDFYSNPNCCTAFSLDLTKPTGTPSNIFPSCVNYYVLGSPSPHIDGDPWNKVSFLTGCFVPTTWMINNGLLNEQNWIQKEMGIGKKLFSVLVL